MPVVYIYFLCLALGYTPPGYPLQHPSLVERYYQHRHQSLFWFAAGTNSISLRRHLLSCIDSAAWQGLDSNKYRPAGLRLLDNSSFMSPDSIRLASYDRLYTDAAFTYGSDLLRGEGIDSIFSYDGVTPTRTAYDDQLLLNGFSTVNSPETFLQWTTALQPSTPDYAILRTALRQYLDSAALQNTLLQNPLLQNTPAPTHAESRIRQLCTSLNVIRHIHHYQFSRFILVNIPSATLSYYNADTLALSMKIVAGQTSKRTPRFAAFCTRLILYPYWNIPRKISVKEMLPLFKKEPGLAALMNIQALDSRGKKVDITQISWASYTAASFPYTLRQAPGCDNALGVLKFDISSPYDVYMHDTNLKGAFSSSWRYLSHGCIRLERPLDLGMRLLNNQLDTTFLRSCFRDQSPIPVPLEKPVPVFVVYLTAGVDPAGRLAWYKDIYHLLR